MFTSPPPCLPVASPDTPSQTKWTPKNDEDLIDAYNNYRFSHSSQVNGSRDSIWNSIACKLSGTEELGTKAKTPTTCRSRYNILKRHYHEIKRLLDLRGAGWDHELKLVTLPIEEWKALQKSDLQENKRLLRHRYQSFPLYEKMALYVKNNASSKSANTRSGSKLTTSSSDTTHKDDIHVESESNDDSTLVVGQSDPYELVIQAAERISATMLSLSQQISSITQSNSDVLVEAIQTIQKDPSLPNSAILAACTEFSKNINTAKVYLNLNGDLRSEWILNFLINKE